MNGSDHLAQGAIDVQALKDGLDKLDKAVVEHFPRLNGALSKSKGNIMSWLNEYASVLANAAGAELVKETYERAQKGEAPVDPRAGLTPPSNTDTFTGN